MKRILRSTMYLSIFVLAGILFQISCSNSDNQTLSTSSTPIGKLIYLKQSITDTGSGTTINNKLYTCNYDGTNETEILITLPSNVMLETSTGHTNIKLSPDGQKIFFVTVNTSSEFKSIYSCDITGNNVAEVTPLNGTGNIELGGAY